MSTPGPSAPSLALRRPFSFPLTPPPLHAQIDPPQGLLELAMKRKLRAPYAPEHDKGLLWNDPALGIDWGIPVSAAILSAKDKVQPKLAELPAYFHYGKDSA